MAIVSKTAVSLRFAGDELDPPELSRALRCEPDLGAAKGGIWQTPKGTEQIARTGMWHRGVAPRSPGDLNGQVAELLALMTDDLAVWQHLTRRFRADVFCGLFLDRVNEGIELRPKSLCDLSVRGLLLGLDIYRLGEDQQSVGGS